MYNKYFLLDRILVSPLYISILSPSCRLSFVLLPELIIYIYIFIYLYIHRLSLLPVFAALRDRIRVINFKNPRWLRISLYQRCNFIAAFRLFVAFSLINCFRLFTSASLSARYCNSNNNNNNNNIINGNNNNSNYVVL